MTKPFCQLKHQMNSWLPSVALAGAEFLLLWGLVLLSLYAKSQPLVPCSGMVCPTEAIGIALVFSVIASIISIVIAIIAIGKLLVSKAYRLEIYLLAILGGIVGAIDLYYLLADMIFPQLVKFYEFEMGLSPPAIVIGFFIIVALIYSSVWVACELEEKQERMEKARNDLAAQAAANHPQE